ncbi:hypothetical protein Tco_1348032, partial [Tanacetum coccineum]
RGVTDAFQAEVPALISKEFADQAPTIIEELFKIHMKNQFIQVILHMGDAFCTQHHDDHQEDDAPPEGEKRAKRQKTYVGYW